MQDHKVEEKAEETLYRPTVREFSFVVCDGDALEWVKKYLEDETNICN